MGLFGKSKKEVKKETIPSLPDLPKLPDFPSLEKTGKITYGLPSFPHSSLGTRFSQDTIKEAVAGSEDEFLDESEFEEDDDEVQQILIKKPMTKEIGETRLKSFEKEIPQKIYEKNARKVLEGGIGIEEPIFIRIDKFEEALKIFSNIKKKLSEIEKTLEEIKKVREKEDNELHVWENEIKLMKGHIEKVYRDIFSKI